MNGILWIKIKAKGVKEKKKKQIIIIIIKQHPFLNENITYTFLLAQLQLLWQRQEQ